MTPKEWAALLHGREYRNELTKQEINQAKLEGIVIVTGYSDDGVDFDGEICDEVGVYGGGTVYLTPGGLLGSECREGIDCPYFREERQRAATIKAVWCPESDPGVSWVYETAIPHETFDIMEGGKVYCRGIVFRLADVALAMQGVSNPATKPHLPAGWRLERVNEREISIIDANGSRTVVFDSSTTGPYERALYALAEALLAPAEGEK